tara:strand:+ start:400 stop:633 length:234 start_codon:yes stop_codon:yes gene_type:complete
MKIKILSTILFYFLLIGNAYAYLDPGTGSLILQLILGGIAAFFAITTSFFSKIKKSLKKTFNIKKKKIIYELLCWLI